MDINTMYAASQLGKQDEYDTQIVKDVWNQDFSNASTDSDMCEAAYEAQGAEAFNKCNAAIASCGSDSTCRELAKKYSQALQGGYSKSFEDFKKKTGTLAAVGDIASGLLGGLLSNLGGGSREGDIQVGGGAYYEPQQKSNMGLKIGIGILALAGIGTAIYFATRKK